MATEVLEVILRVQDGASAPLKAAGQAATQAVPGVAGLQTGLVRTTAASADTGKQLLALKLVLAERLAPALSMVSPQIGQAVAGLGRFASMASLLGGAGGVLVPVAVAVGVLGLAYRKLSEDAKKAEEAQKKAAEAAQTMQEAAAARETKVELAKLRADIAEGTVDPVAYEARMAQMQAEVDYATDLRAADEALTAAKTRLREATSALREAEQMGSGVTGEDYVKRQREADAAAKALEVEERAYDGLNAQISIHAANLLQGTQRTKADTEAKRENTRATKEQEKTLKELALAELEAEIGTTKGGTNPERERALAVLESVSALAQEADALTEIATLQAGLALVMGDLTDEERAYAEGVLATARALEEKRAADEAEAQAADDAATANQARADRLSSVEQGVGMAGSAMSGSTSWIGNLGTIGAIVAAVLGILEGLGDRGAGGTAAMIDDVGNKIEAGIRGLPEFLTEAIGKTIPDLVLGLVDAIVEVIPELVPAIIDGLFEGIDYLLANLGPVIYDALYAALNGGANESFEKTVSRAVDEGDWLPLIDRILGGVIGDVGGLLGIDTGLDSYATGTPYVDRSGLAMVHRGEEIVPEGGKSTRGGAARSSSGSSVTINLSGFIGPEAIDQLDRAMRIHAGRGLFEGA